MFAVETKLSGWSGAFQSSPVHENNAKNSQLKARHVKAYVYEPSFLGVLLTGCKKLTTVDCLGVLGVEMGLLGPTSPKLSRLNSLLVDCLGVLGVEMVSPKLSRSNSLSVDHLGVLGVEMGPPGPASPKLSRPNSLSVDRLGVLGVEMVPPGPIL